MMKKVLSLVLSLMMLLSPFTGAQAEIWLPNSVTTIESEAFLNDASITGTVTMPANVKNIGDNAFAGTDVFSLWMPSGVKSVGSNVLANTNAVYAVVPSRQATIGSLNVPFVVAYNGSPAQRWAASAGAEFINIETIAWYGGFCYRRDGSIDGYGLEVLFARDNSVSGTVKIPAQVDGVSVTAINPYAFACLRGATEIQVPETAVLPSSRVNWPNVPVNTYSVGSEGVVPEEGTELSFEMDHISMNPGEETWMGLAEGIPHQEGCDGWEDWQWQSSDDSVVMVNENGVLMANNLGEAAITLTITCKHWSEEEQAEVDIEVFYATLSISVVEPVLEVEMHDTEIRVAPGVEFYPMWSYIDSSTNADPDFHWISDNEEAVRPGENGQLIAIAPGEAWCTMVGTMCGLEAGATVPVIVYEPAIALNHYSVMAYTEHDYQLIIESEIPDDASVAFESSNEEVLTVDADGLVSVLPQEEMSDPTSAYVTVTIGYADGTSVSETCTFEVVPWMFRFRGVDSLEISLGEDVYCWPRLQTSYYSKHTDCYTMAMEVEDETILAPTAESWGNLGDGPSVNAYKIGTTNVTFKAWLDVPDAVENEQLDYVELTIPVTVVAPYMQAFIGQSDFHFSSVGHKDRLDFWYDSEIEPTVHYFTSSDTSVVTVDAQGLVVAKGPGEATITYHVGVTGYEVTASIPVVVDGYKMTVNHSDVTIGKGEGFLLIPAVDAPAGANIDYNFNPASENIVHVSEQGYVTGLAAGTVVIFCEAWVNGMSCRATCKVTVTDDAAPITLNYTYKELPTEGSFTLIPTFNGEATDVTFTTNDPWHASVDENGVVTLKEVCYDEYPVITVSAIVDGVPAQAYCTLHSSDMQAQIRDFWGAVNEVIGWTEKVHYTVITSSADVEYTVELTSMDENVVTIDENGWAKAVGAGATTIIIEVVGPDGTVYDTEKMYIFIEMDMTAPTDIAFEYENYLLSIGDRGPRETGAWAYLTPVETERFTEVRYESLNPNVVVMDDGWISAVAEGEATIQATAVYHEGGQEKTLSTTAKVYVADVKLTTDKDVYAPGDIATITLENIPEGLSYDYINWEFGYFEGCKIIEQTETALKLRVRQPGDYGGRAEFRVNNQWHESFDVRIVAEGEWVNVKLNESDVRAIPGEQVWIGPEFKGWKTAESTIADQNILRYVDEEDPFFFEMIGTGETTVTFSGETEWGEAFELTANVKVVEPEWSLISMDNVPGAMIVGDVYDGMPHYEFNGYHGLEIYTTLEFSDPSVARAHWDDELRIWAVGAGTCTVTATTELDGRTESLSKEIIVTEPAVYPAQKEIELRPGDQNWVEIIAGQGKTIESLTYTSSDESFVTVDADGNIKAIAVGDERVNVKVYVRAVFTDGTQADTVINVAIIPDRDVYMHVVDASWNGLTLSLEPWGALETAGDLWLELITNAAEHEINYCWSSMDESIAVIDESMNNSANANMTVTAVGKGWAEIQCVVSVGEEGDSFYKTETHSFGVDVHDPQDWLPENAVQLAMEYENITMNRGERATMYLAEEIPAHEGGEYWEWISTNHGVVWPGVDGEIVTDNTGKANYMIIIGCDDGQAFYGMTGITVVEPWVEIAILEEEISIPVGAAVYPAWECLDSSDMSDPEFTYEWSDDSVIEVDEWGRIVGKAPGVSSYVVYAHNGAEDMGMITVNVYEPAVVLNHYNLMAYAEHDYQLTVESEIPEGATVTYTSSDVSVLTVDGNGLISVLAQDPFAETLYAEVVVTVGYADGTSDSSTCSIDVVPWLFQFRDDVPSLEVQIGENQYCWPRLRTRWWNIDAGNYTMAMTVADETILMPTAESWNSIHEGPSANALKAGTTNVTFKAWFKPSYAEESELDYVELTIPVTVVTPYLEARLGESDWGEPIPFGRVGETHPLRWWWDGEEAPDAQYFTSSDESVVTVSAEGVITATGVGNATVTYHVVGYGVEHTASVDVVVEGVKVTLSETEVTLKKGEGFYLLANVDAPAGADFYNHFTSSQWNIASVDGDTGYVAALAQGATVIRYEGNIDGQNIWAECVVHVVDDELPIHLPSDIIYVTVGDTFTLEPTFDGEATDIVFGTEDEERLPIDENGTVTVKYDWNNADYAPHVWCNATINGERVTARMLVRYGTPAVAIRVDNHVRIHDMEELYYLHHEVTTTTPDLAYTLEVTSSDENIVAVEPDGWHLRPVSKGTAFVTLTVCGEDGTVYASEKVNVFVGVEPAEPQEIAFERDFYIVNVQGSSNADGSERGYRTRVNAYLLPDESNMYYGGITYSVANPEIAYVEDGGDHIIGVAAGETTVTATINYGYEDEEKQLTVSVPVYVVDPQLTTDKESYGQMELATLTLKDFPADLPIEWINWSYQNDNNANRWVSQDGLSLTVRTYQPGEYRFEARVRVNDRWEECYETTLVVTGEQTNMYLNDHDVTTAVGEVLEIGPQFGCDEVKTESSNTSIITIDPENPCRLTMVGTGEATVTYTCKPSGSDETVTLVCNFVVNEPDWKLLDLWNLPAAMRVGETYWAEPNYETNTWWGLGDYVTLSISDETVAKVADWHHLEVTAIRTGTFTLTATLTFGGKTESVSREIYVIEPAVTAESEYVEWRSNTTQMMKLIVNDGREIDSVQWTSNDESSIVVNDDGTFSVQDVEGGNTVRMNAVVTFTDGSTDTAMFRARIVPDHEVRLGIHHASWDTHLNTEAWGIDPQQQEMFVHYETNACEEEFSVEWRSCNEAIVTLSEVKNEAGYASVVATAVAEGETQVECTLRIDGIQEQTIQLNVHVHKATLEITPENESLTLNIGSGRYLNFEDQQDHVGIRTAEALESSDSSVVTTDVHGNVKAVGVGTATVTRKVYMNNILAAQASVEITVVGGDIEIDDYIEVDVGSYSGLAPVIKLSDENMAYEVRWESVNPEIALIDAAGMVCGVSRGVTHVKAYISTEYGEAMDTCTIVVNGDALQPFMIDYEEAAVYGNQQFQLSYVLSDEATEWGTPTNVVWRSSDENVVTVDENGMLTAQDGPWTQHATVSCTAELNGKTYTAYCAVTVKPRNIRINNFWSGEGQWHGMGVGDRDDISEVISTNGTAYTVECTSDNEAVVVVRESYVEAVGIGEANVTLTATSVYGEVVSASRYYRVELENIRPTGITADPECLVIHIDNNDWGVPVSLEPMYSVGEVYYHGYDENVIMVDEGARIYPVGVGRTTIQVGVVGSDLTTSVDVVVYDDALISLVSDDEDDVLVPGQTVQVSLSGNIPWTDDDVEEIRYEQFWNENLHFAQDGKLTCLFTEDPGRGQLVRMIVRFKNGHEQEFFYGFSVDFSEAYMFGRIEGAHEFIAYPGNCRTIGLCSNRDLTAVAYESSNTGVATVDKDGNVECVGIGEAMITITATYEDGTLTDTIKVIGRETETPIVRCVPDKQIISVGETVNVYVAHENDFTCPPDHEYVSGNEEILRSNGYQEEIGAFTITGVAPGVTTLTVVANYGEFGAQDTINIFVVAPEA